MTPDPYQSYLRQADAFFAQGEIVKAGQIWQAILKKQPSHAEARARLVAVKQHLLALRDAEAAVPIAVPKPVEVPRAPEPPPFVPPAPAPARPAPPPESARTAPPSGLDPERLVAEGCTLYDMGQLEEALRKWEQALVLDPAHVLARSYANSARRELDLPPSQAPAAEAPAAAVDPAPPEDMDLDKLLREAVQLYDMGLVEEAITKWERVLVLDPQRSDVAEYLRQARTEVGEAPPAPAPAAPIAAAPVSVASVPAPAATPEFDGLDLKLRQADHLLAMHRQEEAAFTFQQALRLDPGNARALEGLERCRKPSEGPALVIGPGPDAWSNPSPGVPLDAQGRIAMALDAPGSVEPAAVEPPAALLVAPTPPREGLSMPGQFRETAERLPWLKSPKVMVSLLGGLLVAGTGFGVYRSYQRDKVLKDEVRQARAAAVAPVAKEAQAPDLAESPAAIRQEAEASLGVDPLRAFLRAETFLSRSPGDPGGAQLLEKARAGLAGAPAGSLSEYQKHIQDGDLEAALKVIDSLLRAHPEDATLRTQASRLDLALCTAHASKGKWDEAQEDLLRGRALFPADKTWQTRLKLLERVKVLPKNQQEAWISLLG